MTDEINFWTTRSVYGWMSNFYRAQEVVDGISFPTNEHFYQSYKCAGGPESYEAMEIQMAKTPAEAKQMGQKVALREDWNDVKVDVMLRGLWAKFTQNPALRMMLLNTGDAAIHEDSPDDLFWGKKGQDMLGKLLMQVREELR